MDSLSDTHPLAGCGERSWLQGGWFPSAEKYAATMISLPIYPDLSDAHVTYIIQTIKSFLIKEEKIMGQEIDLMVNYPRPRRNVEERGATKTDADRALARKLGRSFLMEIAPMAVEALITTHAFGSRLFPPFKRTGDLPLTIQP